MVAHLHILEYQQLRYCIKLELPFPIIHSSCFFKSIRYLESRYDELFELGINLEKESTKLIKLSLGSFGNMDQLAITLHEDFLLLGEIKRIDLDLLSTNVKQSIIDLDFDEDYLFRVIDNLGNQLEYPGRIFANACGCGHLEIVKYVLNELHYDPIGANSFQYQDSFDNAFRFKQRQIISYLIEYGVDPILIVERGINIWKDASWNTYNTDPFRDTRGFDHPGNDYSWFWNILRECLEISGFKLDLHIYLAEAMEHGDTKFVEFIKSINP
ncbi:hypothetical protein HDV06_002512 [Boothiomyces sp. JEL0866]|nr:hypothetical protein HDV06_002512 [Boothiomyces sp. JEL0866]